MRSHWRSERLVRVVARKKIVFVIVEGPSDEVAHGAVLSRLFDAENVFVHIVHGDITAEWLKEKKTIVDRVGDEIRNYARNNHYTKADFKRIIHIADMDGAFVPDQCIVEDPQAKEVIYSETTITARNKTIIQERNTQKSQHIRALYARKTIWDVPYQMFYMSCNLDHVLYNKLNSTDEEKEDDAYTFARKYRAAPEAFLEFICESDFSVMTDYKASWKYIQEELHSLERHTNLGLCFDIMTDAERDKAN